MPVVTWSVKNRVGGAPVSQAQITVTAEAQQGFPFFRIDLWTDQFGMVSADLMGSMEGMRYHVEISHPDYITFTRTIFVRSWPLQFDEFLVLSPTPSYTMTFQVTDAVSKENVKMVSITSTFFSVVTDGIGRASVVYQEDKVGDHIVQAQHPSYTSWEGTVHFGRAAVLHGIELQPIEEPPKPGLGLTEQERLAMAIISAYAAMQTAKIIEGIIPS